MTFSKHHGSHLAQRLRAYELLGVDPNAVAACPKVASYFKSIPGGKTAALRYLRLSDHSDARRFITVYDNMLLPAFVRKVLPFEAFIIASGLTVTRFCSVVAQEGGRIESEIGSLVAASHHVDIVEASIRAAMDPELGLNDRVMQLKHMGFLPTPAGSRVNVNVHNSANAQAAALPTAPTPPTESVIRRMVNRFNEDRSVPQLPQTIEGETVPVVMPAAREPEPLSANMTRRSESVMEAED